MSKRVDEASALLDELFVYLEGFDPPIFGTDRAAETVMVEAAEPGPAANVLITQREFQSFYEVLLESAADDPSPGSLRRRAFSLFSVLLQEAAWDMSEPGSLGYQLVGHRFVSRD